MEDQDRIKAILSDLAQEEKQPGLLQRILMGIPQAISVGLSEKPGEALGEQIKSIIAERQLAKQRRQKVRELGAQLEIEDILDKRKSARDLASKKELASFESDIRNAEFQVKSAEDREQMRMQNEFNKGIEEMRSTKNMELAKYQVDANSALEKFKQEGDIARMKFASQLQEVTKVLPYLKPGEAADIFGRVLDDGRVTKEDITAIQAAAKRGEREEFRQRYELAVGPAREAAKAAMIRNTQNEIIEAIKKKSFEQEWMWVTDPNGKRQLFKYDVDQMTGSVIVPPGYKFDSKAEPMDVMNHFMPLAQAFKDPSLMVTDQTQEQNKDQRIDKYLEGLPMSMTPDDKIKSLSDPRVQQTLELTPQDIERTKAKIMSQASSPTDDPTELAIREIDEEIRRLEPDARSFGGGFQDQALFNRAMTPENRKLKAKLLDEKYALQKRRQDEAQVKYLADLLAQKEAELAEAKTESRKTRIKSEINAPRTGLKARLEYAKSQVGK